MKLEVTMGSNILTRVRASNLVGYLLVFFAVCEREVWLRLHGRAGAR